MKAIKYFLENGHVYYGSEYYMHSSNISGKDLGGELVKVDSSNISRMLDMAAVCFPDWENNREYTQYFFQLQEQNHTNKIIQNYLYQIDGVVVGFAANMSSVNLDLSYLHNMGILPEHRRKGYFTNMVKHLSNYSLNHGINHSFALVDKADASYPGFKKMRFSAVDKYYLYSTKI